MDFEPRAIAAFRYAALHYDLAAGTARWEFELRDARGVVVESFTERVAFEPPPGPVDHDLDAQIERVLAVLGGVIGLSYYKAAAPDRVELAAPGLTDAAVDYLALVLREGLAEFAYRAGLPAPLEPRLVRVAAGVPAPEMRPATTPEGAPLVPIGGGKDSAVSVESLRAAGLAPVQFAVNPNAIIERVAAASGLPLLRARRTLDPRLLELNARGALNGHVPVTAMNTLLALVQARLHGLGPVVMSNESSASDPTLDWNGHPVNHQWSKSLEAERALAAMLEPQAGLRGATFSLLRPFSELRIAAGFARIPPDPAAGPGAAPRYDHAIVSCNRAFRLAGAEPSWCGECDKCRFVFLALAPWMDRARLVGIVGHDLFADPSQVPGFRALLGLAEHKPFECVGEEAESSVALTLASRRPDWADSPVVRELLAAAPEFATGDAALEERILGESEALPVPPRYEEARRALV
ncbi:MAG: hypothetical protein J0G30_07705 [Actinomycetales bacterium]|nr:hypothetical protein [Actinomycetales bacterium]